MAETIGTRLLDSRKKWDLTQQELADKAGVGVATIRRAEGGTFEPRAATVRRLADALRVRVEWLMFGQGTPVSLGDMTVAQQHKEQGGPEQAGLPGYVVIDGGVWYSDEYGDWHVERKEGQQ